MLNKRIREVRKRLKLTQMEFGNKLGVSRDIVANIEYNRVKPQTIFIKQLCSTFQVNQKWLETGEGDIFIDRNVSVNEAIRIFESLNPDFQECALKQMNLLLEFQKSHE